MTDRLNTISMRRCTSDSQSLTAADSSSSGSLVRRNQGRQAGHARHEARGMRNAARYCGVQDVVVFALALVAVGCDKAPRAGQEVRADLLPVVPSWAALAQRRPADAWRRVGMLLVSTGVSNGLTAMRNSNYCPSSVDFKSSGCWVYPWEPVLYRADWPDRDCC